MKTENAKTMTNNITKTLLLALFTLATAVILVSSSTKTAKPTYKCDGCELVDTINKYVNPDTITYTPESIEIIPVTSQFADSLAIAVMCNGADYWQTKENEALECHNEWSKLATRFYKVKDYDSYKAVLWKADSCLSRADEFEDLRLSLERSVEHYKSGKYGSNPVMIEFQLTSNTDTLKDNRFLLTSGFKPLNHKYNGTN